MYKIEHSIAASTQNVIVFNMFYVFFGVINITITLQHT